MRLTHCLPRTDVARLRLTPSLRELVNAPMSRQTVDYDPIEELVEAGRRELAQGNLQRAKWFFEEVLGRQPDHARALLGLSYVTRHSDRPAESGAALMEAQLEVVTLVREKRYEEALELLQRARFERPTDAAVLKSIAHLEMHLERRRMRILGGPDALLALRSDVVGDAGTLAGLIDGHRTVAQILATTRLPRLEALRELVALRDDNLLVRSDGGDFGSEHTGIHSAFPSEAPPPRDPPPRAQPSTGPSASVFIDDPADREPNDDTIDEAAATAPEPPRALGTLPPRAPRVGASDRVTPVPPQPTSGGLGWIVAVLVLLAAAGAVAFFVVR